MPSRKQPKLLLSGLTPVEAIGILEDKINCTSGKALLFEALGSGDVQGWMLVEGTGSRKDIPPEWWLAPGTEPYHFQYDLEKGHGFIERENPGTGDLVGGDIRVSRPQLEQVIEETLKHAPGRKRHKGQPSLKKMETWFNADIYPQGWISKERLWEIARQKYKGLSKAHYLTFRSECLAEDWKTPGRPRTIKRK